jgi:hypothetical protein
MSWRRTKRPPTDFELLKAIYGRHENEYGHGKATPTGQKTDVLVPIDIEGIAESLGVDKASVFGRLYYHLDREYGEAPETGKARKVFFTPVAGSETNCVNFPLLEAVLAGLWQQRRRDLFATYTALVSLAIALASLGVSIVH